jgi:hypothetical protein
MKPEASLPGSQKPATGFYTEPDEVHILTSYFLKIHFNIILSSTPKSFKWSPRVLTSRR